MQLNGLTGRDKGPADVPGRWQLLAPRRPTDDRPADPSPRTLFPEIEKLLAPAPEH